MRDWQDYEYTLEAKKTAGQEGFLILFRMKNEKDFYWCNLGGWGNERHALERGLASQNRWGVVGPQPAGRIESDKWYAIKVRCEGRHFQVWLGDERVIDYTDDERAHLSGKVGIGTWATQAAFRNLKVNRWTGRFCTRVCRKSLTTENAASFWQAFGGAKVYVDRTNPLNSSTCQRIVTDSRGRRIAAGGAVRSCRGGLRGLGMGQGQCCPGIGGVNSLATRARRLHADDRGPGARSGGSASSR